MFGCPLLGPDPVDLLKQLLAEPTPDDAGTYVVLSGLHPDGALQRRLLRAFARRHQLVPLQPNAMCHASLDGGVEGFLSRRSGGFRRNLRAAERRAAAAGISFERHVPTDAPSAAATYERIVAVERGSWKGIGQCGMLETPMLQFYAAMLRRLAASGSGRVMFARHDGRDIGFIFGGLAAGRFGKVYRGQQFSYVEHWHHASIGNLLAIEQIRWLCEEGVERYDMGPEMAYKQHWTELRVELQNWVLGPAWFVL